MWKRIGLAGMVYGMSAAIAAGQVGVDGAVATRPLVIGVPVQRLAVVRTWEELGKVPPLETEAGAVRLGIEATTAPLHEAVAIYARMESVAETTGKAGSGDGALGNLQIRVRQGGMAVDRAFKGRMVPASTQPVLFVGEAVLDDAGEYTVEVFEGGELLARAKVTAVAGEEDCPQAWTPLEGAGGVQAGQVPVLREGLDPMMPRLDGGVAMASPADGKLPQAGTPPEVSAAFHLTAKGDTYSIEKWPGGPLDPDRQLLVAFYINGRRMVRLALSPPMVDKQGKASDGMPYDGPFSFVMHLTPGQVVGGTTAADKVEMQLLYCPAGYRTVWGGIEELDDLGGGAGSRGLPLLSNRVAVTFSP